MMCDPLDTGSTSRPSLVLALSLHGFWFAFHDFFVLRTVQNYSYSHLPACSWFVYVTSLKKYMNSIRVIGTSSFLITHVKTLPLNCFVREPRDVDRYPNNHEISGRGKT